MRMLGQTTYFKYSECNPEDVLIEKGKYLYTKEGKYGNQHYFEEVSDKELKCLNSAGQLDWVISSRVPEGSVVKIVFKGKKPIKKGAMAGKEFNNFQVFIDDGASEKANTPNVSETLQAQKNIEPETQLDIEGLE